MTTLNPNSDIVIKRNRSGRWIVFFASIAVFALLPAVGGAYLLSKTGASGFGAIGFTLGAATGLTTFLHFAAHRYFIDVPQVQGFATVNTFLSLFGLRGDPNVVYGPGFNISFPWEARDVGGNFSLEIITLNITEDVPGKDTLLLVTGSYQFRVDLARASHYIGIDDSTLQGGVIDIIKARISQKLSTLSGDGAKSNIGTFNEELSNHFGLGTKYSADPEVSKFEEAYGIHTVKVTLSGIDMPTHVQKSRDAVDKAAQVLQGVANLYGYDLETLKDRIADKSISVEQYNNMLDRFAAQSGDATMEIKALKVDGLDGAAAIIGKTIGKALTKGRT